MPPNPGDRNFDDLAERFTRRVSGSVKGETRRRVIWRDLNEVLVQRKREQAPLRVLDIGAGLGHFSIELAQRGHQVYFNDLSAVMTRKARTLAQAAGVAERIQWHVGPYQQLFKSCTASFDLILCHALLEWLAQPAALIPALSQRLAADGILSLCFYNPAGIIYRNLIRGNFNWLANRDQYQADAGSLTPNHPCEPSEVYRWLSDAELRIVAESGVRVFSDYVVERRGGHQSADDVLAMELAYSRQEPFKRLGRYLHVVAQRH